MKRVIIHSMLMYSPIQIDTMHTGLDKKKISIKL